uniref:Secreted protein n=1 Tax=Triticum urartu TaxID=4572 RepID=A0A8R7PCB6_TRIUA
MLHIRIFRRAMLLLLGRRAAHVTRLSCVPCRALYILQEACYHIKITLARECFAFLMKFGEFSLHTSDCWNYVGQVLSGKFNKSRWNFSPYCYSKWS